MKWKRKKNYDCKKGLIWYGLYFQFVFTDRAVNYNAICIGADWHIL